MQEPIRNADAEVHEFELASQLLRRQFDNKFAPDELFDVEHATNDEVERVIRETCEIANQKVAKIRFVQSEDEQTDPKGYVGQVLVAKSNPPSKFKAAQVYVDRNPSLDRSLGMHLIVKMPPVESMKTA